MDPNDKKKIGIIGGTGRIGAWFARLFTDNGHEVTVSGRTTAVTSADVAAQCDVVVISLPYGVAQDKAREIGPLMNETQLLCDLCSLKEDIVDAMAESTTAEVVGIHPLFGPGTTGLAGQNVILCPARGTRWAAWLKNEFADAVVTETTGREHDETMALVQGLTHFLNICLGAAMAGAGNSPATLMRFSTPIFRLKMGLAGRLFAQNLDMFRNLIAENPRAGAVIGGFLETAGQAADVLLNGSEDEGLEMMEKIRDFLGPFCEQGLYESGLCLDVLMENAV